MEKHNIKDSIITQTFYSCDFESQTLTAVPNNRDIYLEVARSRILR